MAFVIGKLETVPALERPDLLASAVAGALRTAAESGAWLLAATSALVAPIDPDLADTAAFCVAYDVGLDQAANCVIVAGKRDGVTRYAGCVVLATTRADVNGTVRRHLNVRKASFAAMDAAVAETGMEYGGITPIGLPATWPVLVDVRVADSPYVIIGSGLRASKIVIAGAALAAMPGVKVLDDLAKPISH